MTADELDDFIEEELNRRIHNENGEIVLRFVRISYREKELIFGLHSNVENRLAELMSNKPGEVNLRKSTITYIQIGTNEDRKKRKKDIEDDLRFFARF